VLELQKNYAKSVSTITSATVNIPKKANGKLRPLGILTLKDRVVQILLKMVLEPIGKAVSTAPMVSPCATMDCIALPDSYINNRNKYYWVIEEILKGFL